jgi:hypothetical protein
MCSSLSYVSFEWESRLSSIEGEAFLGCGVLEAVYIPPSVPLACLTAGTLPQVVVRTGRYLRSLSHHVSVGPGRRHIGDARDDEFDDGYMQMMEDVAAELANL